MHNTPFTDMNDSEGETQAMPAMPRSRAVGGRSISWPGSSAAVRDRAGCGSQRNIERSCITVTELADTLVRREGLSFRQAHEIAARTARAVVADGSDLPSGHAAFAIAFKQATDRDPALDEAAFREVTSPEHFVAVRTRYGGPAPEPMADALDAYDAALAGFADAAATRAER